MKTPEEIEKLAEKEYPIHLNENHHKPDIYDDLNKDTRTAFIEGYTNCQKSKDTEIRAIIKTHTDKLNIMKDNLSRWEEERWTESEMRECESMIKILASILSDLNRSL